MIQHRPSKIAAYVLLALALVVSMVPPAPARTATTPDDPDSPTLPAPSANASATPLGPRAPTPSVEASVAANATVEASGERSLEQPAESQPSIEGLRGRVVLPHEDPAPFSPNWTLAAPDTLAAVEEFLANHTTNDTDDEDNDTLDPTDDPDCQSKGQPENTHCYGVHDGEALFAAGNRSDVGLHTAVSDDGKLAYVSIESRTADDDELPYDTVTVAYNTSTLDVVWKHRYDGAVHGYDAPIDMQIGPDGQALYLAIASWDGYTDQTYGPDNRSGDRYDAVTLSLDAETGEVRWEDRYEGTDSFDVRPTALSVSEDGTKVATTTNDPDTLVHDADTGERLQRLTHPATLALDVAFRQDADGLAVTGYRWGDGAGTASGTMNLVVHGFRLPDGAHLWTSVQDTFDTNYLQPTHDLGWRIESLPGDRFTVTGRIDFLTVTYPGDFFVRTVDGETGKTLWERRIDASTSDVLPIRIEPSPSGERLYLAGFTLGDEGQGAHVHLQALDTDDGATAWARNHSIVDDTAEFPVDLEVAPDGSRVYMESLVATSEIYDPTTAYFADTESTKIDYVTTGWTSDEGEQLFAYRYDGSGHEADVPFDLSLTPDGGTAIVTGARCLTELTTCWDGDHDDPEAAATVTYDLGEPPTANLTADTTTGQAPTTIAFTTSAADPDGAIATWRFDADGDGDPEQTGTGAPPAQLEHTYADGGTFQASLWVNDTDGGVGETTATIELGHPAPAAAFDAEPAAAETGQPVSFTSTSVGNLTEHAWSFGDGTNATGSPVEHAYTDDGTYTVSLTVTDAQGRTDTTSQEITIANRAPAPDLTFAPVHPSPGETVTFTADASDPDGTIASLDWQLHGLPATGPTAERTFPDPGVYEIALTATDDDGGQATRTVHLQVGLAQDADAARGDLACQQAHAYCQEWNDTHADAPADIDYLRPIDKLSPAVEAEIGPDGATVYRLRTVGEAVGDRDVVVHATSAVTDELLWERTLDAPDGWRAESRGLALSPDGTNLYVTASTWQHPTSRADELTGYDATTWALDSSTGKPAWRHVYDGGDYDASRLVEASPDGASVHVALNTRVADNATDIRLLRLDAADGDRLAESTVAPYDHLAHARQLDRPVDMQHSADGERLLLVTKTDVFAHPTIMKWEVAIHGIDADTLQQDWDRRYRYPSISPISYRASNVALDGQNGKAFLAIEDLRSYTMRAFDQETGEVLWSSHYVYGGFERPVVTAGPGGETFYVAGTARDPEERLYRYPREDLWIRAFDADTGEIDWTAWHGKDPEVDFDPLDVEASPGGTRLFVAAQVFQGNQGGRITTQGEEDVRTLAFATADGSHAFSAVHGEPLQRDLPFDLEISPRGDHALSYGVYDAAGEPRYEGYGYFLTLPPEAQLAAPADTGRAPFEATFSIQGEDPDGSIDAWRLDADGDGEPDASGQGAPPSTVTHTYTDLGIYEAELALADEEGAVAQATATVTVEPPLPDAAFDWTPRYPDVDETVTFTDLSDSVGGTATWDFGDGNTTTVPVGETVNHSYAQEGLHTITLTITDTYGQTDVTTERIDVGNERPEAAFHLSPERVNVDEPVVFHQYAYDVDGTVETYRWHFGDGTTATGSDVTHSYDEAGTYEVTLTVSDDRGAVTSITEPVEVRPSQGVAVSSCEDEGHRCATWTTTSGGFTTQAKPGVTVLATETDNDSKDVHVVARHSRTAEQLWTLTYDSQGYTDTPTAIATGPDADTVYVTGRTYEEEADGNLTGNVLLLAIDASSGELRWSTSWDSPTFDGGTDMGMALDVAPDGSQVYVGGVAGLGDSFFGDRSIRSDLVVAAFAADDGATTWLVQTDDPHDPALDTQRSNRSAYALDVEAGPEGERLHVAGQASIGTGDQHEAVVLSLDATDGSYAWSDADMGAWWAEGVSVEAGPSGETVYWGAWKWRNGEDKVWIVDARNASSGETRWAREMHVDAAEDQLEALALGPRGQVLVAAGWTGGYKEQAHAVRLDADTGETRWTHTLDDDSKNWHTDAQISPDGSRIALGGGTFDEGARTVLLDVDGDERWRETTEQISGEDFQGQVAFEPDGRHVTLTGRETGFFGASFADPQTTTYPVSLPPRADPVAEPGEQAVDLPVSLVPTAGDPDGTIEGWQVDADGDGAVDASGQGAPPTPIELAYEEAGTHRPELSLIDGEGGIATSTAIAEVVDNRAPSIEATDTYTVTAGELAEITVNATDPDGDPVTWTVAGDEELANVQTAVDANGTLTWSWSVPIDRIVDVQLTVTAHDAYHEVERTLTVDVQAIPRADVLSPMEASTGTTSDTVLLDEDTVLRGHAEDPDGPIVNATFHPEGLGGPTVPATLEDGTATAAYDYNTTGEHTIVLTVEDADGLTQQAQRTVTVTRNVAPIADAGADALLGEPGTAHLDAGESLDPEGRPLSYVWSLPDGSTVSGPTASFEAPAGVHTATLTVQDTAGATASDTVTVTVDDALHAEAARLDEGPVGPRERPTIAVAVSDDQGTPRAGANVTLRVEHPASPATGITELEGTTDAEGRLLVRLPYDLEAANAPGEHRVSVDVDDASRPGAAIDDTETASDGMTYVVEAGG